MRILGIRFETGIALALVADRLVDTNMGARVDWLALVDICNERFWIEKTCLFICCGRVDIYGGD